MAPPHSVKRNHMATNSFPANPIHAPSNKDPAPAHSSNPTRPSTKNTPSDFEAALTLLQIRASSTNKPAAVAAASIPKSSDHPPSPKYPQASKIEDQERQQRRENAAAYQRRRRAKQPSGHRRAENRRYMDRETESHREERLRKKREAQRLKRSKR